MKNYMSETPLMLPCIPWESQRFVPCLVALENQRTEFNRVCSNRPRGMA